MPQGIPLLASGPGAGDGRGAGRRDTLGHVLQGSHPPPAPGAGRGCPGPGAADVAERPRPVGR